MIELTTIFDLKRLKISISRDGAIDKIEIESSLSSPNNFKASYFFEVNENFKLELRLPSGDILSESSKVIEEFKDLAKKIIGTKDSNIFFRISKKSGVGSLDLFIHHTEIDDSKPAIEIQCKLHVASGHKNDHIVYINHLIPIEDIKPPESKEDNSKIQ